jgi:hypothetical protein
VDEPLEFNGEKNRCHPLTSFPHKAVPAAMVNNLKNDRQTNTQMLQCCAILTTE